MSSTAAPVRAAGWATRQGARGARRISVAVSPPPGVLLAAFVVLRLVAVLHAPTTFPDTGTYTALDFLGRDERLWTVPLVWNIVPGNHLREGVQIVLGIVAWSMFAVILSRMIINKWVRWLGMASALMLGLVTQVTNWDNALLSESLSTSLLVILVGVLLLLFEDRRSRVVWACLCVATLWVFTRQSNVMIYLGVLPFLLVFTLRRSQRRRAIWVAIVLVAIGLWGGFAITRDTAASGALWKYNAVEILEDRIAPDPSALQFFEARGLPHPPVLLAQRGAFRGSSPLFSDPSFMGWVDHHFKSTYLSYLLRHLTYFVREPLFQTLTLVSEPLSYGPNALAVLPTPLSQALWGTTEGDLPFWLAVAAALAVFAYVRGLPIRRIPIAGLLLLAAVIGAIVIWNSATEELPRLFLPVAIFLRLGILLTIAFSADALIEGAGASRQAGTRQRQPEQPPPATAV